jgi:hypothetical protein
LRKRIVGFSHQSPVRGHSDPAISVKRRKFPEDFITRKDAAIFLNGLAVAFGKNAKSGIALASFPHGLFPIALFGVIRSRR